MARRRIVVPGPNQDPLFEPNLVPKTSLGKSVPGRTRRPRRAKRTATQGSSSVSAGTMVFEFHESFALPLSKVPTLDVPTELVKLRHDLLAEEVTELEAAIADKDLVGLADALGDITYVIYGTAVTFGIDLDAVVTEIHRANMSKLGPDGKPILRSDGKVLKGPGYQPPDIAAILGRYGQPGSP